MTASTLSHVSRYERLQQFVKFCLVGGSGVFVDMGVLFLLADPRCLGLNITLSKILSAEAALTSNFVWNELWTFRDSSLPHRMGEGQGEGKPRFAVSPSRLLSGIARRFVLFNAICGVGIGLAMLLLHLFYSCLGCNLYVSNLLAIVCATFWNFDLNTRFNWQTKQSLNR